MSGGFGLYSLTFPLIIIATFIFPFLSHKGVTCITSFKTCLTSSSGHFPYLTNENAEAQRGLKTLSVRELLKVVPVLNSGLIPKPVYLNQFTSLSQ